MADAAAGLGDLLKTHVADGTLPGAVALVARGGETEVAAVGSADVASGRPMSRDSLFRIASLTKPLTAAAVMALVDDGRIALGDPIAPWLPELAAPMVVRTPDAPVDDVVPAARPVTVEDLMTFRAGWGFPSDFSWPAVAPVLGMIARGAPHAREFASDEEWLAELSRVPMLYQPGEAWLYNTCSDILGTLVARVGGRPLPEFLAERLLVPLGMADTGFEVAAVDRDRFTTAYERDRESGELVAYDTPDGLWSGAVGFASGAGGLVSTVDDLHAFARMILAGGETQGGRRLLSRESVRLITTDHLTPEQRAASALFTGKQGWGFGGTVDVEPSQPWHVVGRYGWTGGSGTTAHLVPATGAVTVLLTQVAMTGPTPNPLMREFWTCAAR
ncbi:serine hydrolase domain-containing protein [Streptomyces sp. NPDC059009]|uniref:serine hydrolase domain-containing protein n=1 Tax=Streptomyces sp. NPDC059009 TaxID=3346694 RepID=UPI0036A8600C